MNDTIFFNGKNHKDVYFDGHYHKQAWKNGKLIWEKGGGASYEGPFDFDKYTINYILADYYNTNNAGMIGHFFISLRIYGPTMDGYNPDYVLSPLTGLIGYTLGFLKENTYTGIICSFIFDLTRFLTYYRLGYHISDISRIDVIIHYSSNKEKVYSYIFSENKINIEQAHQMAFISCDNIDINNECFLVPLQITNTNEFQNKMYLHKDFTITDINKIEYMEKTESVSAFQKMIPNTTVIADLASAPQSQKEYAIKYSFKTLTEKLLNTFIAQKYYNSNPYILQ